MSLQLGPHLVKISWIVDEMGDEEDLIVRQMGVVLVGPLGLISIGRMIYQLAVYHTFYMHA